ncbi:hypothetical protein J3R30DRAFT_578336 [Lentinula aciculospora]|uniref:Uncharacterized protein n=1 Tax=Lentinula aciculospora TaxID=153920 RepID=A0A9W9DKZ2_9AGAR|nr:hypothetical protein J3R30DRAFT_578336 [Lentinula aciculospora]
MSPPSAFPPEIYDKIIDEVSSSKDALAACSLVERSWKPKSRTHMFRDIDFTVCSTGSTDLHLHKSIEQTAAFQDNVASNADVALYARRLVVTLNRSGNIASEIPQASKLRNLRSLTLKCSNIIVYAVNDAILSRLLSFVRHNQNLEYISLQSLIIDPSAFDVFMKCIGIRAPELRSLHLQSVWGPDWTTVAWNRQKSAQRSQPKSHTVRRLCISHCEDGAISMFLSAFDLKHLDRIALMNLDWDSCVAMIVAILNSPSLTHFTLDLSDHRQFLTGEERIFDRLVNIPTVQLLIKRFSDAPMVLQGLQRAASQRKLFLKQLHLHFRQYPCPSDTMVDAALHELHLIIPSLRVSIGFQSQEGIQTTKIGALFRWMSQTGMLHFDSLDAWWTDEAARY